MQTTQNKTAGFFGLAITAVGFLVLLGWQFDIEFLKRLVPGLTAMNPVTAFGFVFSGIIIYISSEKKDLFLFSSLLSVILILTGFLKLSDYVFSFGLEIDNWLFNQQIISDSLTENLSRFAPATAFNFIAAGISFLLSNSKNAVNKIIANYMALLIFLSGLFFALGYFYFVPEFKGILATHPMALHTAICFLVIALAIAFMNHDHGFMKIFTGTDSGGYVARIFLPVVFGIAICVGFILVLLIYYYSISSEMVVALAVSSAIVSAFFISWYIAAKLHKADLVNDTAANELVKATKELALSNERLLKFFITSPVATVISSINDGRFVHVNNAYLKLFSFSHKQVIGKTSVELKMLDQETRLSILKQFQENNFIFNDKEITLFDANGKALKLLSSAQRIEINGELYLLNTLVDITERKANEQQIIKNRKNLNDAQRISKTGSWEFNLNTQELFWSDQLYHIFELEQTTPEKLYEECRKKIHPDDLAEMDKAINLANEKGVAAVYEHRIILKDGSIRHLLGLAEVLKYEKGEQDWLRGTTQDITERKEFEISLEKARNSLAIAQEIAGLGSWEWDIATGKNIWSDEQYRIFGYQPGEIEVSYSMFFNCLHPDDKSNVLLAVELALKGINKFETEYRIISKKGEIKHIEARGEVEKDRNDKAILMRGTVLDITERKLTNQKLRDFYNQLEIKNKELEQYAFIASHDLQEPLRTISSFTELLTEEYSTKFDNNATTYIRFISQSALRMRDLITALLDYSRLGNKIVLKQIDCNAILKHAMENLQISIKESGAVIKAENLPKLKAYPIELELLFQNLIGNAIKFRKKEVAPEINIQVVKRGNEWQFSFSDNGIGIDEKYFEKIFLLFQRLHSRDNYKGSGIGLSHCKKIVELHNGKIWVESKAGEGSTFYVTIPELAN